MNSVRARYIGFLWLKELEAFATFLELSRNLRKIEM
jgi:hypothetical protein